MGAEVAIIPALEKRGIDEALWAAIGSSVFPGASDESKLMAIDYCKARGLDVMKKVCHIVPMSVKDAKTGNKVWRDVIMPGIADTRITACRTGAYAGQDEPIFGEMVDLTCGKTTHLVPECCTVTVYRMINGERVPFSHTEYFEEACGTTKDGSLNSMWTKRKRGQLAKCTEAGALRKAFPEELGGMITADEVATDLRDVTPQQKQIDTHVRDREIDPFNKNPQAEAETTTEPASPKMKHDEASGQDAHAPLAEAATRKRKAYIVEVNKKSGTTDDRKWEAWLVTLSFGDVTLIAGTFSKTDGGLAEFNTDQWAMVEISKGQRGWKLESIEIIDAEAPTQQEGELI